MSTRMDHREYLQWQALYEVEGRETQRAMKRAKDGKGPE